jgi:hypothetical protein
MPSAVPVGSAALSADSANTSASDHAAKRPIFPGWRWAVLVLAIPLAGLIGWALGGHVDGVGPALLGGVITGAGLGAALWFAANGVFGDWRAWVGVSAVAYSLGLAAGAALVDYGTEVGSLAAMGAITGVFLGAGQGVVLAMQDRRRLAVAWGFGMPVLLAIGWSVTTLGGIDVDNQFTIFGAFGAIVFTLLSGLLFARFLTPAKQAS